MTIQKDRVVAIEYELKGSDGQLIDSSEGQALEYLHGNGNLIPGLESQLEGKQEGDSLSCVVAPADGYGERDDELIFQVGMDNFAEPDKVQVGTQFHAPTEQGLQVVTVTDVEGDTVTVDANHPLAGKDLHFSVTVKSVRDSTDEERAHGHVHGAGHDHDECGEDDCGCSGDCSEEGCGCSGCH